ncbi:hypothetical protein GCM10008023_05990 [Sphingomonas glacialis]|uniref:Phage tail tape measure protein n=1 Tax=Sphingomonas glacialis TaxID=658225 RepID=A0ABQ3L9J5_9SPHN|nr:hypothetical protein [Sphingomonas glacialis]GHH09377.1 hypothetical protein GCM10008023_05990 [Sphingomonas glacialis]
MSETEASVKIVGDASGVAPAVNQTKDEIAGLGPALAQLTAGFAELAAEIRASMATTAASTAELTQEMHQLKAETEKESLSLREMALSAKEAAESISEMKEAAFGFAEAFLAAFAVEQIADWAKEFAEAAEHVEHLGQQFGMTAQQVQGLGVVAQLSGVQLDTITKGLGILDKNLFSGAKESVFKQMGIEAGDAKDQVDLLAKVADKFKGMDDGPKKAALAMDLFGRAGAQMIPILNQGGEAMREAKEKAEEYGAAYTELSDGAQEKGVALAESINESGVAWKGVTNVLGDAFGPALKDITDGINSLIKAFVDSYTEGGTVAVVFEVIVGVVETVGAAINGLVEIFSAMWEAVIQIVGDLVGDIMDAFGIKIPGSFKTGEVAINLIKDAFVILKDLIVNVIVVAKAAIMGLIDTLVLLGKIAYDAFNLNWSGIQKDWDSGLATLKNHALKNAQEIESTYQDLARTIAAAMNGEGPTEKKTGIKSEHGGAGGDFDPDLAKQKKEKKPKKEKDDLVQQLEAELTAKKLAWSMAQDAQGTAQAYSLQSEADYWQAILQRTDLSAKDRAAVETKYLAAHSQLTKERIAIVIDGYKQEIAEAEKNAAAKLAIAERELAYIGKTFGTQSKEYAQAQAEIVRIKTQAAEQVRQIDDIRAKAVEKANLDQITAEETLAKHRVATGAETSVQLLTEQKSFEDRRYAIELAAAQRALSIADPNRDPVKYAQLNAQIEQLERSHIQKMAELDQQQVVAQRARFATMSKSFGDAIGQMATFQKGFVTSVNGLWTSLLGGVERSISRMVSLWIESLLVRDAAESSQHLKSVARDAKSAASGAYRAVVGIPIVGPILAPIAAATAFAGVMAFSAEGGYDVPSGGYGIDGRGGSVGVLHPEEMVLPAALANGVRAMIGASSASGSAPAAANDSGDQHFHYHDHTEKGVSASDIIGNRAAVAKAMKMAHRELRVG